MGTETLVSIRRIEVASVSSAFGATLALRSVSLEFEAGTITTLEGPNGAGKSTLLAVMGGMLRPTTGSVRYDPLGTDPAVIRRHLGWVAHDSHCYRDLGSRENVEFAAQLHGVATSGAWASISRRVGAEALEKRRVSTLSRGQRQRIALARALVHSPSVLLLDEPWSGLDAETSLLLERVICEERDRGALVVVVSHQADIATRLNARRVRLEAGRVASNGQARAG